MAYPDLCTVDDVKAWHDPPITQSTDDESLQRLVSAESIAILISLKTECQKRPGEMLANPSKLR